MRRRATTLIAAAVLTGAALTAGAAAAEPDGRHPYTPGAPGAGDPYFPLYGNGGYDVRHYRLQVTYDPATDTLTGTATITARATQNLSSFNLDLVGLTVRSITVDSRAATWSRSGGELTVTPARGLPSRRTFTTVVRYDGVPEAEFRHTDDGAIVLGQPEVAARWFPADDHPIDKASYSIHVTVPQGVTALSNGVLERTRTRDGWTTFEWEAREPMASYLSMLAIGEFDVDAYRRDGVRYWDAVDPDLFVPVATPRTGSHLLVSGAADASYKRLARTITVPADGARLSFWTTRATETRWDFVVVEARTAGQDDWTTLPDANGHTSRSTGLSCPSWHALHPFLTRYQTDDGADGCTPTGTTGEWHAATGSSDGYEQWDVDLSAYAGSDVEVSISYVSDEVVQGGGVFVDDVEVSTGEGSTSFEPDGDPLDGWTVPGAPAGSAPNANDWLPGTQADVPQPVGPNVQASLARQDEVLDFLEARAGRYPFSAAGGVVDDTEALGFALETQTRPVYAKDFFTDRVAGDSVVVHELAHQWFGDSVAIEAWQHIWLNEGFASYAEWMWSEAEGHDTAQEIFDFYYARPADHPFWARKPGDPQPGGIFSGAVYDRGAMTLHVLRRTVGDEVFFRILRRWAADQRGGNANTAEFVALAERVSHRQLDTLFQDWLFTAAKPPLPAGSAASADGGPRTPLVVKLSASRHDHRH